MVQTALLISDDMKRSADLVEEFGRLLAVERVTLAECATRKDGDYVFLIVDARLESNAKVAKLGRVFHQNFKDQDKVFVIEEQPAQRVQANSLGATDLLTRPWHKHEIARIVLKYRLSAPGNIADKSGPTQDPKPMLAEMSVLQDSFYDCIRLGRPLPLERTQASAEQIASHFKEQTLGSWLDVVKAYDSYTYRHCMTVSGLMAAYARHIGFSETGIERMALAGLVHDIGKVRIPLAILDKPGELTDDQDALVRRHPLYSGEILRLDGQFDAEIIDMAQYHHEYLDGSGFPIGLVGDQIRDGVRIMTIIDVFSSLIDTRSPKQAKPADQAFDVLRSMTGKVEGCLVDAFQPIAEQVSAGGVEQLAKVG